MTGAEVVLFRKARSVKIRSRFPGKLGMEGCMSVLDKGDITIYRYHCICIKDVNESRQNSEQKLQ